MKYTITAATGHLGREVVKELSKLTDVKNIRLAVRSPQKAADLAEAGYEVMHSTIRGRGFYRDRRPDLHSQHHL